MQNNLVHPIKPARYIALLFESILKYIPKFEKITLHFFDFSHFQCSYWLLIATTAHRPIECNYKLAKSEVPYIFGYGVCYKLYLLSRFFDEVVWSWVSFRYIDLKWKKPTKDVSCKCDEHRVPHSAHAFKVPLIKSYGLTLFLVFRHLGFVIFCKVRVF